MAHFAELDVENNVLRVVVIDNKDCQNAVGEESESIGSAFCSSLFGENTYWKQCSYNGNIRKNYPSVNFKYDESRDAFIPPMPFESWSINEDTCEWQAPIDYPNDGNYYIWDEENINWQYKGALV